MRSKFDFSMKSKLRFFVQSHLFMRLKLKISFDQEVNTSIMRLKFPYNAFLSFDLMNVLVTNKLIMRLKLKKALLGNFNLMDNLLVTSLIMR
jgi:hypothetical protein